MDPRTLPVLLLLAGLFPDAVLPESVDDWLDTDAATVAADRVNEGELRLLMTAPAARVLHTRNRLILDAGSLTDGWARLEQCQGNLDPVAEIGIEYRYQGMRGLRIVSTTAVAEARVEGESVQLTGVGHGGEVCIAAEVRALRPDGRGGYLLRSGPFHRRFLDGYYPLRLDYRVEWPADRLVLATASPAAQPGFTVTDSPGSLRIDTLFEGRLTIELHFESQE